MRLFSPVGRDIRHWRCACGMLSANRNLRRGNRQLQSSNRQVGSDTRQFESNASVDHRLCRLALHRQALIEDFLP